MKVKVRFLHPLSTIVGAQEIEMDIGSGSTINTLLETLAGKYKSFKDTAMDEGGFNIHIGVFLNNKPVSALQGLETVMTERDEIMIFFPVAGG